MFKKLLPTQVVNVSSRTFIDYPSHLDLQSIGSWFLCARDKVWLKISFFPTWISNWPNIISWWNHASPLLCGITGVINQVYASAFWTLKFIPFICLTTLMLIPHCFFFFFSEALIGFIKQLMNQEASHLVTKKALPLPHYLDYTL